MDTVEPTIRTSRGTETILGTPRITNGRIPRFSGSTESHAGGPRWIHRKVPLIGDVQLVVIQDLNTARNCRFRHDSNDFFRRQRKEACCSIGAEAEDPERLRYSECFRCHALQLFSLERRFVSPAPFADFGRSSCGSDKSPGDVFNCLSGLLASSDEDIARLHDGRGLFIGGAVNLDVASATGWK